MMYRKNIIRENFNNLNTYLDRIEHDLHDVARTDSFTVLLAIIIASVAELTIIISPTIICIRKGL